MTILQTQSKISNYAASEQFEGAGDLRGLENKTVTSLTRT